MNDTSRQILSIKKSASAQIAKFCRLRSRFCKILSIKTLFKLKQGIKYTLFKFTKSFDSGLNMSFFDEFSQLSRTFPDSPKIFSIKNPRFPHDFRDCDRMRTQLNILCHCNQYLQLILSLIPTPLCYLKAWK